MEVMETVEIVTVSDAVLAFGQTASLTILGVLALGALVLLATCFFVVDNGFVAVIERMGSVAGVRRAGLHIKAPWPLGRVLGRVPLGPLQGGGDLALRTRDGAPVRISVQARLTIPAHEAPRALSAMNDPGEDVDELVRQHLGARLTEFSLGELTQGRGRLALELVIDLGEALKGYGLRVVDVVVGEPRTTVDVWRLRELQLPVLPTPTPMPEPGPMPGPGPGILESRNGGDACPCADPLEDSAWLRLIVAMRAANPGMSEESILGIVHELMNEDFVLRVMNREEGLEYDGNLLIVR